MESGVGKNKSNFAAIRKILNQRRRKVKRSIQFFVLAFVFINVIAFFHAYKFTHFATKTVEKTKNPTKLSATEKLKTLVFGVNNPRPETKLLPEDSFETVILHSNRTIECWDIKTTNAKGTVVLFHGFSADKSTMLDKAAVFRALGYSTLLVDFMGSGGSQGNQTTIGFLEAEQVYTCYNYLVEKGERNIYLFGTSMGSAAIMKAVNDYEIKPKGIIVECPFGSMYETVCARFEIMNAPTFPMAGLLVFWGGVQNGFLAFSHNPTDYAKNIDCPTLLLYGAKDDKVSRKEIDNIFCNLSGPKSLRIYSEAAHENYLTNYKKAWTMDVSDFLNGLYD